VSVPSIRAVELAKRYRINQRAGYQTLREAVAHAASAPIRALQSSRGEPGHGPAGTLDGYHWALDEVSFEVTEGEVVGIIGRNGAGKTTLLKILSRITEPTRGFFEVGGRVASLLEVGTGFHPELTGRENVYLNGAILGMKRSEIMRKFNEIVAFSEIERFINTPVKRYSTGMQVRLAFAVAAHLEPEILLVDEVLAVGDARFQQKCLAKMEDVGQHGRTVLFISHNTGAITRLCRRAIWLDAGRVVDDGPAHRVAAAYLGSGLGTRAAREWPDLVAAPGDEVVRLGAVRVRAEGGEITDVLDIRKSMSVEVEYEVFERGWVLAPNLHFLNDEGAYVFVTADFHDPAWRRKRRTPGRYVSTVEIRGNLFSEGGILVGAAITSFNPDVVHLYERDAVSFQVVDSLDGDSARGDYAGPMPGVVRPLLPWTTERVE